MADPLIYEPLADDGIRLLRLEWAVDGAGNRSHPDATGAIRCSISNHRLDACPDYTALSYTWGTDPPLHDLLVGGGHTKIRKNLYGFLAQALPDPLSSDPPRGLSVSSNGLLSREVGSLWIDALCINQRDDAEKATHLAQMAKVYAKARRIVIWLGDAGDGSDLAMDFYTRTSLLWATDRLHGNRLPISEAERVAIERLTRREYWSRSWVYQEATTPGVLREVWCGGKTARFDALCVVNALAHKHMLTLGVVLEPSPWNRRVSLLNDLTDRRKQGDRSITMLSLLHLTQGLEATNPSDKIYALLNIYGDIHGLVKTELPFSPDYSTPVEDVFQAVAEFVLERTRELDLLLFCSVGQYKRLRSWVPNFYQFTYTILGYTYLEFFSAGGTSPRAFHLDRASGRLSVRGVRVDSLTAVHRPLISPGQPGAHLADAEFWQPIFSSWTRSLAHLIFPEPVYDRPYVSRGTTCEAVDWVLSAGMSSGYGTLRRDQDITHWPIMELVASPKAPEISTKTDGFQDLVLRTCKQSMFVTSVGYIGFGDADAMSQDVLVVLPGLRIPMIFRPVPNGGSTSGGLWRVVGPCLVKGIMDGEALGMQRQEEEFTLI